jgi:ABC-2 type transport system permease protein
MATDTATRTEETRHGGVTATGPSGLPVVAWVLRTSRRSLLLWSLALAAVSAIYAGFWSAMGDTGELQSLVEGMPEGLVQALGYDRIGTPAGYLESTVFGLLGPILLLVFGISLAARILATQEEDGTLELELTLPIARRRVLLERYLALTVQLVVLSAVVGVVVTVVAAAQDMGVSTGNLAATTLGLFLLGLAIASVGFAAGAASGRKAVALAVGAGVAVVAFMADALAGMLQDGDWLSALTPFGWYLGGEPLTEGIDPLGFLLLLGLAALALVIAVVAFERRDLGV